MKRILILIFILSSVRAFSQVVNYDKVTVPLVKIKNSAVAPIPSNGYLYSKSNKLYFGDKRIDASVSWLNILDYGADSTGVLDAAAAINSALADVSIRGGTIYFPSGKYKVSSRIIIPNDGTSPVGKQKTIKLLGSAGSISSFYRSSGTLVECTYAGTGSKIFANGYGLLQIENISFYNSGNESYPILFTTKTTLKLNNCGFYGYPSHCVDAVKLGGLGWGENASDTSMFGGYGTVIENCWFDYTKKGISLLSACNGVVIKNNHFGYGCSNEPHIYILGYHHPWYSEWNSGGTISDNLFEMDARKWGIWANNANNFTFNGNTFYDMPLAGGSTDALFKFGPNTRAMTVLEGFNPYGPIVPNVDSTNAYPPHYSDSGRYNVHVGMYSQLYDLFVKNKFTAASVKTPSLTVDDSTNINTAVGVYNTQTIGTGKKGISRLNLGRRISGNYSNSACIGSETKDDNAARGRLTFSTNSYGTMTEWGRFTEDGYLGIGTTNPATKVEVDGEITAAGGRSGLWNLAYANRWTAASNGLYYESGNVAIGQWLQPLKRKFAIKADNSNGYGQLGIFGETDTLKSLRIGYNTTGNFGFVQSIHETNALTPLVLQPDGGKIGIGTTSPLRGLHVTTNFQVDAVGASTIGSSSTSSVNETADVLFIARNSSSASVRTIAGIAEALNGVGSTNTIQAINGIAQTNSACASNLTTTTTGGGLRSRYLVTHNGSGTISQASAISAIVSNSTSGSGTITDASCFHAETFGVATGKTTTNASGLWVRGGSTGGGTLTNRYGILIDDLVGGTNRYGIYQVGTSDKNYFGGTVVINGAFNYAADAQASDTYVITLSPAITAYTAGLYLAFKANTINAGVATINVNGLGAKTIVKRASTTLADGDIVAGQLCMMVYDGTNFILINPTTH
jgi:hypothetical protein